MALIRCLGCDAVHDSRLAVCPGCGRCPGCGARLVSRRQWAEWASCPRCGFEYCAQCGRCHGCQGLRFDGLAVGPCCGFLEDPARIARLEETRSARPDGR